MPAGAGQPGPVTARVATREDVDAIANTLARAFYEDPVWGWAFPDPDRRLEQHRAVWAFFVRSALDSGWVWLTEGCAAAAVWIPPDRDELRPEDEEPLRRLVDEQLGEGAARVLDTQERFEAAHPHDQAHFHLTLLGTHPEHRGRGIGMGLLDHTLARIDAEGAPAFLESTNPANDHRYERLGFRRRGEFELSEDGPEVTQMWREPGGGP
jgi:ribosomal protein S18 acetylase RimI-like enzyme